MVCLFESSTCFEEPDVVLIQLSSWGWAHSFSKYVEDLNKYIIEEIVRQVGYLPEPYVGYIILLIFRIFKALINLLVVIILLSSVK